jgi:choline dehydrogenase-like flavoprotein
MGTNVAGADSAAAVDPKLRVMGLDNLRVAGARCFHPFIGGNIL